MWREYKNLCRESKCVGERKTSRVIVRLERSTGLARKIAATSKTSRRTVDGAETFINISSLSEKGWCVMSCTCSHKAHFYDTCTGFYVEVDKAQGELTASTSISFDSWLSSFLIESSVPGTTVKIREVPGVSDGPTARLCRTR